MISPTEKLRSIVATLRGEGGCPWDREQTHTSLKRALIEEAYEVIEAIDAQDAILLEEELGDLLLQVVMHAQIAQEAHEFDLDGVIHTLSNKLVARHPHVFVPFPTATPEAPSDRPAPSDAKEVLAIWQARKAAEKPGRTSVLDGVPPHLPAAMRAQKLQEKASKVGFDWQEPAPVIEKIREEILELEAEIRSGTQERQAEEVGDLLFTVVNLSRSLGLDAEEALRQAGLRFEKRFRWMERSILSGGQSLAEAGLGRMEEGWQEAKKVV